MQGSDEAIFIHFLNKVDVSIDFKNSNLLIWVQIFCGVFFYVGGEVKC